MTIFDQAIGLTFAQEGNGALSLDDRDPGNWTGGVLGHGKLRGSRWGISAASYPALDIETLSRADAQRLALVDFWSPMHCELMPPALALLAFDFAFQSGVGPATRALQTLLAVRVDGDFGPLTINALRVDAASWNLAQVCAAYQALRLAALTRVAGWASFSTDWSRRVCTLLVAAAQTIPPEPAPATPRT